MVVVMVSTDLVPGPNPQDSVQWQKLRNNQDYEIFTPESNKSSVYVSGFHECYMIYNISCSLDQL